MAKVMRYRLSIMIDVPYTEGEGPDITERNLERLVLKTLSTKLGYQCDGEVMEATIEEE